MCSSVPHLTLIDDLCQPRTVINCPEFGYFVMAPPSGTEQKLDTHAQLSVVVSRVEDVSSALLHICVISPVTVRLFCSNS